MFNSITCAPAASHCLAIVTHPSIRPVVVGVSDIGEQHQLRRRPPALLDQPEQLVEKEPLLGEGEEVPVVEAQKIGYNPGILHCCGLHLETKEPRLGATRIGNIPAGVTLAGTRGKDGCPGARLFTATFGRMLTAAGDDIRLTGLRFEGAYLGTERIAGSGSFLSVNHDNTRVDNCGIYGFNISGIGVGSGALKTRIHHNYIHHCQRGGYGSGGIMAMPCRPWPIAGTRTRFSPPRATAPSAAGTA